MKKRLLYLLLPCLFFLKGHGLVIPGHGAHVAVAGWTLVQQDAPGYYNTHNTDDLPRLFLINEEEDTDEDELVPLKKRVTSAGPPAAFCAALSAHDFCTPPLNSTHRFYKHLRYLTSPPCIFLRNIRI